MKQLIYIKAEAFKTIKRIEEMADHLMVMDLMTNSDFEDTLNLLYKELDAELKWYKEYHPMVKNFIRIALKDWFYGKDYYLSNFR